MHWGMLSLDLASSTGYAYWLNGEVQYGTFHLPSHLHLGHRLYAFRTFLGNLTDQMALVGYEMPFCGPKTAQQTAKMLFGLAAITEEVCAAGDKRCRALETKMVRKRFIARQVSAGRDQLKAETILRCRELGFSPKNDDEADALAGLYVMMVDEGLWESVHPGLVPASA